MNSFMKFTSPMVVEAAKGIKDANDKCIAEIKSKFGVADVETSNETSATEEIKETAIELANEAVENATEEVRPVENENSKLVNPIVVEEPSGKAKINLSNLMNTSASMAPAKNTEETTNPFTGDLFNNLSVLDRIKFVLQSAGITCDIVADQAGLFKANMFIADAHLGSFYIDRDGVLINTIPKIVLSLDPDVAKLEEYPMLALFNSNWPSILIEFTKGNIMRACDCITDQERGLIELIDLASIPSKIKDSQRAKLLKNLELMKMEKVFNDILVKEPNSRFRIANYKDSGTFDLISDDNVRKGLLAPYIAKQPHRISVDLTKGGDERFVKVAL